MGVLYHNGCKDIEGYKPCALEGIYYDWERCCAIKERLKAHCGDIGVFHKTGKDSFQHALEFLGQYKALQQSLRSEDTLLREPFEHEVDAFFEANHLSEFSRKFVELKYSNQANLSNRPYMIDLKTYPIHAAGSPDLEEAVASQP